MVEMAIITPLLLLMFLGVFEVGYVLRNQLIVMNTSREAARFATKGDNIIVTDDDTTGYETVIKHSVTSAAGQLQGDLYYPGESGIIISNIIATVTMTDCANGTYHVIYPIAGREHLTHSTPGYDSRIDFASEAQRVGERQRNIACRYTEENGQPLAIHTEHEIIVEMFYTSYQLLGVPLLSNPLTDPIPLYSRAVMRKVTDREN